MNGAHREIHHPACPLLPRRRRLRPAHPLQTACFPKPRLFIFTLFSRCLFSLLRSGLPFFLRSLFLSRASPRSTLSARESGVLFPARSKTPLRSLLRPGCSFSSIPACPLSYPVRFPFASPRSLFRLSPQCHPVRRHFSSSRYLPLLALPPFSPIPAVCCHLPLPFCLSPPVLFSFLQSFLYRRKKAAKKALPLRKRLPAFGFSRSDQ